MNQISSLYNTYGQTYPTNLSTQYSMGFNSLLGANSYSPQYSSSLMQSFFGGSQSTNPLNQFFQQLSGSGMGYSTPSSSFGLQGLGGYGYNSQGVQSPPPPPPPPREGRGQEGRGQECSDTQGHHRGRHSQQNSSSGSGQLQQSAEGEPITYTTSGGYQVSVDGSTINITDPNGQNTVKTWGDPHENVNGTHVSDWQDKQRTIVLDDGTKITMSADNPKGVVESMSIYDGSQSIQIDNNNNKVTNQTYNPFQTRSLEQNEYDGSVAYLRTANDGSLNFANYYTQDQDFGITRNYQLLATVDANGAVTDHFDDPTHANT